MGKNKTIHPGGVDEYIHSCTLDVQPSLQKIRSIILEVAPGALETVSYFQIPGYSIAGYDYNGMFVWFSFKPPHVRLHVRPPVIDNHAQELCRYVTTKSIVSFPIDEELPVKLIKALVQDSIKVMKQAAN